MTLQQFLEKWNGQFCEIAGSANAKNQCVDLANAYLRDVCNHPIVEWTNAVDFPSKIKDMEWIPNDEETDLPKEGDILIWKTNHIAIYLEGTTSKFNSFDQNWPLYSPCHVQSHNYTNVIGWLRPNGIIQEDMTDEQKKLLGLINDNGLSEGDLRWLVDLKKNQTVPNLEKKVGDLESSIKSLEEQVDIINTKLGQNEKDLTYCQKELKTANKTIENISVELETANKEKTNYKSWYEAKCKELKELSNKTTLLTNIIDFIKSLFKK